MRRTLVVQGQDDAAIACYDQVLGMPDAPGSIRQYAAQAKTDAILRKSGP